ncbi:MAG: hypothetical protein U0L20_00555 [Ruminococcus sp.]|nr:hypothetical protein [Ruminococcus sp.]
MKDKINKFSIKNLLKTICKNRREKGLFAVCIIELMLIITYLSGQPINTILVHICAVILSIACSIMTAILIPSSIQTDDNQSDLLRFYNEVEKLLKNNNQVSASASYYDTDDPNLEFNLKLNKSISETKNYTYFGDRALYLSKRLGQDITQSSDRLKINVFLVDIRDDNLFRARTETYLKRERAMHRESDKQGNRSIDEIISEEKLQVIRSIYALGKLKDKYDINVYLHKEIPFIRFEITDRLLVLSFLTQLSSGKKYPATVIYENEGIFKPNFEDYIDQIITRSHQLDDDEFTIDSLCDLIKQCDISITNDNIEASITEYYEEKVK